MTSGRRLGEPLRHPQPVTAVAFSPEGHLATACKDSLLRIWDVQANHGVLKILSGHQDWVLDVAYSPDGHYLASASLDKSMKLWNAQSGAEVHTFSAAGDALRALFKPHPIGNRISLAMTGNAEGSGPGSAVFCDVLPEEISTYSSSTPVMDLGFRPDGTSLVTTAQDGRTALLNTAAQTPSLPLTSSLPSDLRVTMARLSLDGQRLAVVENRKNSQGDSNTILKVRDIPSGGEILSLNLGQGYLHSVALSSDGKLLATAGNVRLWDLQERKEIPLIQQYSVAVSFSPDGKLLATAGADGIQIQTVAGKLVRRIVNPTSPVLMVMFSPDGNRLATASLDLAIRIWDVATGQELRTLQGHTAGVTALAFSPDSRRLASGSRDTSIKIWDVESGQEIFALHGHIGAISALAFSPGDGKWLATAGIEGSVRLEPMKLDDLVGIALNRLPRGASFTSHERWLHLSEERQ